MIIATLFKHCYLFNYIQCEFARRDVPSGILCSAALHGNVYRSNKKNSFTVLILMLALTFMLTACDQTPVEDFHLANTTWIGSLTTTVDDENTSVTVKIKNA